MRRVILLPTATTMLLSLATPFASAQVYVRAPFVRVQVDGYGVHVRAPFVNLAIPSSPTVYYVNPPTFVGPVPEPSGQELPAPKVMPRVPANPDLAPPEPAQAPTTLEEFARGFQPKPGSYEVTLLNPISKQPTTVRFMLPEGTPRRVNHSRQQIEFDYGPRRYVRIEFDRDGVEVRSRDR